jgi:hypothetical protein
MRRWLGEPLLHFVLGGALLFALYTALNPASPESDHRQIRIGAGEVKWLVTTWQRQWGREPTAEELRMLVAGLVKEELLAREAREMRLDEGDTIVRRRLAQKLEFVVKDTARLREPTDEELRRFYEGSPKGFLTEPRISFSHTYVNAGTDARAARPKLLESEFRDADPQTVAATFGPQFARAVFELEPGAWHGPIESGYGQHLVRVSSAQPAQPRDFADVRPLVVERWREQESRAVEERFFEQLKAKYKVVVEE